MWPNIVVCLGTVRLCGINVADTRPPGKQTSANPITRSQIMWTRSPGVMDIPVLRGGWLGGWGASWLRPEGKGQGKRETERATGLAMAIYTAPAPLKRLAELQEKSYEVSPHRTVK